ncbi:MAG: hypothetical protein CSA18_00475 [Deltaproteobacteria bacterium]|nr:MAG: hypothetical protein CSA18_00475 [Deltaproteobacteria bacterium]
MIKIDCHIHTIFCKHAEKSIHSYIEHAIKNGLKKILFLEHLTLSEKNFKNSMTINEVPLYFYAVKNASEKYKNIIDIKCGIEADFHEDFFNETQKICEKFDFDMIGGSVHFIKNFNIASRKTRKDYADIPQYELVLEYFRTVKKMVEYGFIDTVCHFDLIFKFGISENLYIDEKINSCINSIIDIIAEKKISMEINTSGFTHPVKRQYPSFDIIKKCKEKKIGFTIGSDAHSPEQTGRYFKGIKKILGLLNEKNLVEYKKREKYEILI